MPLTRTWDGVRIFQVILLIFSAAWHAYLCFPGGYLSSAITLFVFGMAPYCLLVAFARWISSGAVLGASAAALAWFDLDAFLSASKPGSSTSGVGLAVEPLFGMFVVIPVTLLAAYAIRRLRQRGRERPTASDDTPDQA
jgi:hypothetical protein